MINTTNYGGDYPPMMRGMSHHPEPSKMAQDLLSAADSNGDGSISKAEFTSLMQGAGKTDTTAIDNLFTMLDKNGDGSVSNQESADTLTTLFDNMRNQLLQSRGLNAAAGAPGTGGDTDGDDDHDRGGESRAQAAGGVNPRIAFLLQGLLHEYQANQSTTSSQDQGLISTSA